MGLALKNACVSIWKKDFPAETAKTVGESLAGALTLRLSERNPSSLLEAKKEEEEGEGKEKGKLWRCLKAVPSIPRDAI